MMLAIAYASIMAMLGWRDGDPDWRGISFGLWFYGSMLVVKWHLDVNANGVSIYYQPLPRGARARKFAREEIAERTIAFTLVYGRQILLP